MQVMVTVPMLALDPDLDPPRRQRAGDAAADLPARHAVTLAPGERAVVPTGFAIGLPAGFAALVVPRSGLAAKHGITVVNGPGLIDSGYRGELMVILLNTGTEPFAIERGDRIAQLLVLPVPALDLVVVDELPEAVDDRGADGFGSSGR